MLNKACLFVWRVVIIFRVEIFSCLNSFDNLSLSLVPPNLSKDRWSRLMIRHLTYVILEYMSLSSCSDSKSITACRVLIVSRSLLIYRLELGRKFGKRREVPTLGCEDLHMWWICVEGVLVEASKVSKLFALHCNMWEGILQAKYSGECILITSTYEHIGCIDACGFDVDDINWQVVLLEWRNTRDRHILVIDWTSLVWHASKHQLRFWITSHWQPHNKTDNCTCFNLYYF